MRNINSINEGYFGDELTRYGFISHMEAYMKQLLTNPKTARVDQYLLSHGIDNDKALRLLLKKTNASDENSAVLIRNEKIKTGEDGKDIFSITYKLPRENYKRKMRDLYINCFESNIVKGCPIDEANYRAPQIFSNEEQMVKDIEDMDKDGKHAKCGGLNKKVINETDCGGCMQGGGDNPDAGQYVAPLNGGKPIKRTVYMTEDQVRHLKKIMGESTTTFNVTSAGNAMGDITPPGAFGDKETMNHKNICADPNLMKGGVTGRK